ncbi:hypothetical protein [Dyella silvae]|uniref:hypothetical protein n=1 Tax=Dyella silvae TaxID=2994424 RepID=UPI0022656C4B|nr:hypothetical protein [Dyella silvae]
MHYDDMDELGQRLYRMERENSGHRRLKVLQHLRDESSSPHTQVVQGTRGVPVYRTSFFRPLSSNRID